MITGSLKTSMCVNYRTRNLKNIRMGEFFEFLRQKKLSEEFELIRVYSPCPWGTIAYWISKKAARRALEMVDYRFEYPVDFFLFSKDSAFWKKNLIYSLTPAVVTELPETHSVRMELDEKKNVEPIC